MARQKVWNSVNEMVDYYDGAEIRRDDGAAGKTAESIVNKALKGTPFEVSYRVLNELTIMVGVLLDDNEEGKSIDDIINQAVDNILLMKILPRIEGDADMFAIKKKDVQYDNRLKWLESIAPDISTDGEEEEKESKQTAREKIHEMIERLDNQEFTRFWP